MSSVPLQNIREQVQDFQQAAASIQRIREFIQIQSLVKDPQPTQNSSIRRLPPGAFSVEFREVSFHYDENENVLEDINFCLQPGRRLGVLGRTGSGKTTLTRLLFRLYDPNGGAILLNGSDIRGASISDLRARVGLVTQDVQLFQATIRENLAFFNQEISDGAIVFALQELGLWDWLQSHSQGLDTRLLTGGQGLSAGEAQLLAFTRIFLKDPGLVILDEASSRLDPATETLLEHAIDRLFRQRTGMIIAHRLRTVQRADDILILDKGRVIEYGPRLLLANNPSSHFHHLLRTGLEEALV
jgi:ABC-type multidrug transport system fused ATPase/permease subunit